MIPKSAYLAEFTQIYQLKPSSFSTSRRFCPFEGHEPPPTTPTLLPSKFCFPCCRLSLTFPEQIQTPSPHLPLGFPTGLFPPKHLPTTFLGMPTVELYHSLQIKKNGRSRQSRQGSMFPIYRRPVEAGEVRTENCFRQQSKVFIC